MTKGFLKVLSDWLRMKTRFRLPLPLIVMLGFVVPIVAGILIVHFLRDVPSYQQTEYEMCTTKCKETHRQARLVPLITNLPASSSAPYRGPWKCECY